MEGITYYYAVTAVDQTGNEGPAVETSATSIVLYPEPRISTNEAGQVVVSWTTNSAGWYLQESPDSTPGSWVYSLLVPAVVGDHYQLTVPVTAPRCFFRFILP